MAISKNDHFYEKYILVGEFIRIKSATKLRDYYPSWHDIFGGIDEIKRRLENYQEEYDNMKRDLNFSQEDIKQLAQRPHKVAESGNISEIYLAIYSLLSNDVHSNSLSLDDYYSVDDYKNIQIINYGPRDFDIERSLTASIGIQIQIFDTVANVFELTQYEPEIKEIHDKLIEYGPEFK
jgi:hypothetical protein